MPAVQPILLSTPPPLVPPPTAGLPGVFLYLHKLLVWLQQQLVGIRNGEFDKMATWETLIPVPNTTTDFIITAGRVRFSLNGAPQAFLLQGGAPIVYTASTTPAAGEWTLVNQVFRFGVAGGNPQLVFVIVQ